MLSQSNWILIVVVGLGSSTVLACGGSESSSSTPIGSGGSAATGSSGALATDGGPPILTVDAGLTTTLAMGKPSDIAVDATHVYWTDQQAKTVMKVPKSGGAAITLASSGETIQGIAVDATHVYWGSGGASVVKVPLEGGTPITIASSQLRPGSFAVDGASVFWANGGADFIHTASVMKASLVTGEIVTLATGGDRAASIVLDANFVYWTEDGEGFGSIQRVPSTGGAVELIAGAEHPGAVAVGAGNVYWSTFFLLQGGGAIVKKALAGGPETRLLSSASHSFSTLVADGANLYCPEGRAILRMAADGSAVAALPTEGSPLRLAIDETHIYFTTAEGAVMAIAKP